MDKINSRSDMPLKITLYAHCRQCIEELPKGISPQEYASFEFGVVGSIGYQLWCKRHDCNVALITRDNDNKERSTAV